jgi:protein-disulfide isomerase
MRNSTLRTSALTLTVCLSFMMAASAQDNLKREALSVGAKCMTAEHEAVAKSNGISKEQADAIVSELKQIRQLLEKQQVQLARAMAPQPMAAPDPPDRVQMRVGEGWHSTGRADAPVTLVEFADYQCSFCKRFHTDAYAELKKNYIDSGKVRFVSRDLPLEFHPFALKAAEAVRCAGDQNKYWELRDALYSNAAPPNGDVIRKAAESLSLDMKGFQACLDSDKYKVDIEKDASDAAALNISGTPSFVLGKSSGDKLDGLVLLGALPYASFDSSIQQMLNANRSAPNGKTD